jgi:hypothetical protein
MDRSAGMCWNPFLLWLQWTLYGGLARGRWLLWRFGSYDGMVRCYRTDDDNCANRADRVPSGKGWVAAETQKTNDWQLLEFFTASTQLKRSPKTITTNESRSYMLRILSLTKYPKIIMSRWHWKRERHILFDKKLKAEGICFVFNLSIVLISWTRR